MLRTSLRKKHRNVPPSTDIHTLSDEETVAFLKDRIERYKSRITAHSDSFNAFVCFASEDPHATAFLKSTCSEELFFQTLQTIAPATLLLLYIFREPSISLPAQINKMRIDILDKSKKTKNDKEKLAGLEKLDLLCGILTKNPETYSTALPTVGALFRLTANALITGYKSYAKIFEKICTLQLYLSIYYLQDLLAVCHWLIVRNKDQANFASVLSDKLNTLRLSTITSSKLDSPSIVGDLNIHVIALTKELLQVYASDFSYIPSNGRDESSVIEQASKQPTELFSSITRFHKHDVVSPEALADKQRDLFLKHGKDINRIIKTKKGNPTKRVLLQALHTFCMFMAENVYVPIPEIEMPSLLDADALNEKKVNELQAYFKKLGDVTGYFKMYPETENILKIKLNTAEKTHSETSNLDDRSDSSYTESEKPKDNEEGSGNQTPSTAITTRATSPTTTEELKANASEITLASVVTEKMPDQQSNLKSIEIPNHIAHIFNQLRNTLSETQTNIYLYGSYALKLFFGTDDQPDIDMVVFVNSFEGLIHNLKPTEHYLRSNGMLFLRTKIDDQLVDITCVLNSEKNSLESFAAQCDFTSTLFIESDGTLHESRSDSSVKDATNKELKLLDPSILTKDPLVILRIADKFCQGWSVELDVLTSLSSENLPWNTWNIAQKGYFVGRFIRFFEKHGANFFAALVNLDIAKLFFPQLMDIYSNSNSLEDIYGLFKENLDQLPHQDWLTHWANAIQQSSEESSMNLLCILLILNKLASNTPRQTLGYVPDQTDATILKTVVKIAPDMAANTIARGIYAENETLFATCAMGLSGGQIAYLGWLATVGSYDVSPLTQYHEYMLNTLRATMQSACSARILHETAIAREKTLQRFSVTFDSGIPQP